MDLSFCCEPHFIQSAPQNCSLNVLAHCIARLKLVISLVNQRSVQSRMDLPKAVWTFQKPYGPLKSRMDLPKAVWTSQKPYGPSKSRMDLPKAVRTSQKPNAPSKSHMDLSKAVWTSNSVTNKS